MRVKESFWDSKWADLVFFLLVILFAVFYYDSFLTKGPFNIHAWRQTDCLSLAHFYKEGASFFSPEMHIQMGDGLMSGKTAGEFPILYYLVGQIWKITGESYLVYRVVWLLILLLGIFAFYKSLRLILLDWFWSATLSLLLFTSPIFITYGVSFLTDAPAFSFALIACYFLLRYSLSGQKKFFLLFLFFFTIVGGLKISSLIAFIFFCGIFIFELLPVKRLKRHRIFKGTWQEALGLTTVFLLIFSWYAYASYYNSKHGFLYTFNNIYPFNLMNSRDISEMKASILNFTSYQIFSRSMLFLLAAIGLVNLFLWKKMSLHAYLSTPIVFLGCFAYFYLWAPLMHNHDYYYVAMLILFPAIFIPFFFFLKEHQNKIFKNKILKVLFVLFLSYNFLYAYSIVKLRTLSKYVNIISLNNPEFYDRMDVLNYENQNHIRFEDIKPYLREIGIQENDKIISLPDPSFNVSLYLMNQKGYSGVTGNMDKEYLERFVKKGGKYFVISDSTLLNHKNLSPLLGNKIGQQGEISIYRSKLPTDGIIP